MQFDDEFVASRGLEAGQELSDDVCSDTGGASALIPLENNSDRGTKLRPKALTNGH